jgi:hypothetical protein
MPAIVFKAHAPDIRSLSDRELHPTDPHYPGLKALDLFNSKVLKNQFLSVNNQINLDNVIWAKQYDLLLFQELCFELHVRCLRSCFHSTLPLSPRWAAISCAMLTICHQAPPATTCAEVLGIYSSVPWIVKYFLLSTFPVIFTSEEYLISGCRFVEAPFCDDLASQLVGSYLVHRFNFRDRFHDAFFDAMGDSQTVMFHGLVQPFLDSLRNCIPYFARLHLQVVSTLRRENKQNTFSGVFDHF